MASMGLVREDGAWTAKDFTREQQEAILIALHGKTEVMPDGTMKVTTMGMDQLIGEFFGVNMKLELGSSTEADRSSSGGVAVSRTGTAPSPANRPATKPAAPIEIEPVEGGIEALLRKLP